MQKMAIITASGKSTSVPAGGNHVKIIQPGTTVKITVAKEMISGSQKEGNNLVLVEKNGSKITIEDFFKTDGTLKNKLILEDGGKAYEAKYNAENFAGLAFFPVKQAVDENTDSGEMNTAVWLVPLLVAAAAGIGIAIYNNKDDGNSHDNKSSDSKEKQALSDAQKDVVNKDSTFINAQKTLAEAVKAMQANPSTATIKAVEEASAAVKTAMDAMNKANTTLKTAVDAAKAKGIDTTAAEKIQKQAAEDAISAKNAIDKAAELVKTAIALIDESAQAIAGQVKLDYQSASDAATIANKQPAQSAIEVSKAKLTAADAMLGKLYTQIEQLSQLIANAKEQGFNVDNAAARLKDLQEQYASFRKESTALADSVAQAEQSLLDLNAARMTVDAANEALKQAVAQKSQAAEKLASALALKEEVLKNNQLDRVDEVNKAIAAANKSLEAARQATEAANAATTKANADINKLNPAIDPAIKPQNVTPLDMPDVKPIDKGLQVDDNKTFVESVQAFIKSLVDSVNSVWTTIANSKSLAFLSNVISEITAGFKTVSEVLGEKVVSAVKAIKTIEKALVEIFINKPIEFIKDILKVTGQKIAEAIGETVSAIKTGFENLVSNVSKNIADALKGMSLTDWVNPLKWNALVGEVISKTAGNIVKSIADLVMSLPTKIIDFFTDAITKYAGIISDKIKSELSIAKEAITNVLKTLFDGFIKNPIDKLLTPVLDKIKEFISHPVESIQKLLSTITDLAKDAFNIIKDIIKLPGDWLKDSFQLIKDIYNSFKGDSVKNGDGSELHKLMDKILHDQQSDAAKVVSALLKSDASSGDINLSKLLPESLTNKIQSAPESSSSSVTHYHTASAMDDMHSSLPVAA